MRHSVTYIALLLIAIVGCDTDRVSTSQPAPEPKSRVVFRAEDGRELTADDVADATGTFEYEIVSTNDIPDKANELHQKARQLGVQANTNKRLTFSRRPNHLHLIGRILHTIWHSLTC